MPFDVDNLMARVRQAFGITALPDKPSAAKKPNDAPTHSHLGKTLPDWTTAVTTALAQVFSPTASQPYPFYLLTTGTALALGWVVYRGTRRFPTADHIPPRWVEKRKPIRGRVVRISDSDNVRIYHTPWLWFGQIPDLNREYMKKSIHVRLAGVDAPESSYFSMPSQPFSAEAKEWIALKLRDRRVKVIPCGKDRYNRLLGMVYVRSWFGLWQNVSLKMVQAGYATVYKQHGAQYGGILEQLERAEAMAKRKKRGMWSQDLKVYVSPAEHKRKHLRGEDTV
ncbi:putative endonuclease lcl3 [Dimargaris verticillata]|uniref:Endonuclease lcl3 n=1 Tax=Dimargaris verticillata TaxID=2761393 RepID=A0A9W8B4Z1_9FUNG|nr:putative endonuclease lcl3 [Dimargaris verticillata]